MAPIVSWPSRKTVAVTWNGSPTTAFAGRAPLSTDGRTSRTGMRPMAAGVAFMGVTSVVPEAGLFARPWGGCELRRKGTYLPAGER